MVIRRLTVPGTTGDHRVDYPDFEPFMLSLAGVSYEKSKHDLIGSVLKFNKQDDLSSVFCSGMYHESLSWVHRIRVLTMRI